MAMLNRDISVLTIVKNRTEHFLNLVEGLTRSTVQPKELVVVDMSDVAAAVPKTDFPVYVERLASDGLPLARARNLAAAKATSKKLLFLDVDCIPLTNLIGKVEQHLSRNDDLLCPEVRYLASPIKDRSWSDRTLRAMSAQHPVRPFPEAGARRESNYGLFWSLAFGIRATVFDKLGGFDERFTGYGAEDTDFAFRAQKSNLPLIFLGGAAACHQFHDVFDPPLQHFDDIVNNAKTFYDLWQAWPMSGWLDSFRAMGLIDIDLNVLRRPTLAEIRAAQREKPF